MSKTIDVAKGLASLLLSPRLVPLVPIAILFKQSPFRTDEMKPEVGSENDDSCYVDRCLLPRWARFWGTPDEALPGGLYEPAVREVYRKWGWYVTACYWLMARNQMYGLAWAFGQPADAYLNLTVDGYVERRGLWRWQKTFGPLKLLAGWKVHRKDHLADAEKGPFWAIPFVSVRLAKQG